jgi:hypothetical protein
MIQKYIKKISTSKLHILFKNSNQNLFFIAKFYTLVMN